MTASLPVLVLACSCWSAVEPVAPYTTRADTTEWGCPSNGLSLLAATDSAVVDLGAVMRLEVFFRLLPFHADNEVQFLDSEDRSDTFVLQLTDTASGTTYLRTPFDVGMPPIGLPADHWELRERAEYSQPLRFHLLSAQGEQIRPGEYELSVMYTNNGGSGNRRIVDDQSGEFARVAYAPGTLWTGDASTGVMALTVRPASPAKTTFDVPTAIRLQRDEQHNRLEWDWDGWEEIQVQVRPGYVVGTRLTAEYRIGEDPLPQLPQTASKEEWSRWTDIYGLNLSQSLGGPLQKERQSSCGVGGPHIGNVVSASRPLTVSIRMELFETSEPGGHMWTPERGDFAVLHETVVSGQWHEDEEPEEPGAGEAP